MLNNVPEKHLEKKLKILEQTLQHRFIDQQLAINSIIHPSFTQSKFEILEFIGDRAIGLGVAKSLYNQNIKTEKKFAQVFTSMTNKNTLLQALYNMNLDKIILWRGEQNHKDTILSDACEAIFGALFLDAGISSIVYNIEKYWPHQINHFSAIDPRNHIQEWAFKYGLKPQYSIISESGQPHNKIYTSQLNVGEHCIKAKGNSKKQAHKNAAQEFIKTIISINGSEDN